MHPKVSWWSNDRIAWYERAARFSTFHKKIANVLYPMLKGKHVAEFGSGLGFLSEELCKLGLDINAYDIDKNAVDRAIERTGLSIYHVADCYDINEEFDVALAFFFGKITENDNLSRMTRNVKEKLIYVTNASSNRHTTPEFIAKFLDGKRIQYTISNLVMDFPQPIKDIDELNAFLSSYYDDKTIKEKKKTTIKVDNDEYPYLVENKKNLTIFEIHTKGEIK